MLQSLSADNVNYIVRQSHFPAHGAANKSHLPKPDKEGRSSEWKERGKLMKAATRMLHKHAHTHKQMCSHTNRYMRLIYFPRSSALSFLRPWCCRVKVDAAALLSNGGAAILGLRVATLRGSTNSTQRSVRNVKCDASASITSEVPTAALDWATVKMRDMLWAFVGCKQAFTEIVLPVSCSLSCWFQEFVSAQLF